MVVIQSGTLPSASQLLLPPKVAQGLLLGRATRSRRLLQRSLAQIRPRERLLRQQRSLTSETRASQAVVLKRTAKRSPQLRTRVPTGPRTSRRSNLRPRHPNPRSQATLCRHCKGSSPTSGLRHPSHRVTTQPLSQCLFLSHLLLLSHSMLPSSSRELLRTQD